MVRFCGYRLVVQPPMAWPDDPFAPGESVAVDGCCLTVVEPTGTLTFDLSPETLARTVAGGYRAGDRVNLERAMKASARFGGHVVQGHVDHVGTLASRSRVEEWEVFTFDCGKSADRYLVDKGSVAVNGVSLTVVSPDAGTFSVALIPHTLACTNLGGLEPSENVNIEFDVLAKYAEKLLRTQATEP